VLPEFRDDQKAIEFFNRCLAALLLGGIYCEAVTPDNLDFGSLIDWKYLRTHGSTTGALTRFHQLARLRMLSSFEAIELMNPHVVTLESLAKAEQAGLEVLNQISELAAEFLLKGTTGIARRDWNGGLSNIWIVIEQLTSHLWTRDIVKPAKDEIISGRLDQLRDTRTWSAAARHEVLFQKGIITRDALQDLYAARKSRNELAHSGVHPSKDAALAAYRSVRELFHAVLGRELPLFFLDLSVHSLSDPFKPRTDAGLDPQYWMEIPKLPGEAELEKEEAKLARGKSRKKNPG